MKISKDLKKVVTDFYNNKLDLNQAIRQAADMDKNFDYMNGASVLQSYAKELGLWLSSEDIEIKIVDSIKSTTFNHYIDILNAAKKIEISQLSFDEIKNLVVKLCKVEASTITPHSMFKAVNSKGKTTRWGDVASWIMENPEFTEYEILHAGLIPDCPNRKEYIELAIGFRFLYDNLKTG